MKSQATVTSSDTSSETTEDDVVVDQALERLLRLKLRQDGYTLPAVIKWVENTLSKLSPGEISGDELRWFASPAGKSGSELEKVLVSGLYENGHFGLISGQLEILSSNFDELKPKKEVDLLHHAFRARADKGVDFFCLQATGKGKKAYWLLHVVQVKCGEQKNLAEAKCLKVFKKLLKVGRQYKKLINDIHPKRKVIVQRWLFTTRADDSIVKEAPPEPLWTGAKTYINAILAVRKFGNASPKNYNFCVVPQGRMMAHIWPERVRAWVEEHDVELTGGPPKWLGDIYDAGEFDSDSIDAGSDSS